MIVSTIHVLLPWKIRQVWDAVTAVDQYPLWRSGLERVEVLSKAQFVEYTGSAFVFTTYGYGHGVGMSQNGARHLAEQGYGWREITIGESDGDYVEVLSGLSEGDQITYQPAAPTDSFYDMMMGGGMGGMGGGGVVMDGTVVMTGPEM